jgi:hypothetical protein
MRLMPLERDRTQTLLGVRFWDRLTQQALTAGLQVTAQRLNEARTQRVGKPVRGQPTPSGAIAFFGLTAPEKPAPTEADLWESPPPDQWVVVDVVDRRSQFLPLSFLARLPLRGVFRGQGDWLTTDLLRPAPAAAAALGIQLWSAPTRFGLPGRALVRAQLVVGETAEPAAYALARVRLVAPAPSEAFDYFGMADEQGQLLLMMPYPRVPEPPSAATPYPPLEQQTFNLRITVQYQPDRAALPGSAVPNLEALLTQAQADIGDRWNPGPPPSLRSRNSLNISLPFGSPLILRTALGPGANAQQESVLRILPR